MARVGLSRPYFAIYRNELGTVAYLPGGVLGKYTELDISLDDADDNILYADNAPAESDRRFSGGTATITTDDLDPAVLAPVLGIVEEPITLPGLTTEDPAWLVFDDDQAVPYLGLGGIVKSQIEGVTKWQAFVLPKIQLQNPDMAVTTEGETIEWQTPKLTATIMRSDAQKHRWHQLSDYFDSEADAELALSAYLDTTARFVPAGSPGGLVTADGKVLYVVSGGHPAAW